MIERLCLLIVQGPERAFEETAARFLLRWELEPEYSFGLLRLPEGAVRMEKHMPYQQELQELRQLSAAYGKLFAKAKSAAAAEKKEAALTADEAALLEHEMKAALSPLFEKKAELKAALSELNEPFRKIEARMEQLLAQLKKSGDAADALREGKSLNQLHARIRSEEEAVFAIDLEIAAYLQREGQRIQAVQAALEADAACRSLRDYGALLPEQETFVLCGWMRKKDVRKLQAALTKAQATLPKAERIQCRAAEAADCCVPLKTPVLVRGRWVLRRFRPFQFS